jgi:hypothetical protein
VPFEVFPIWDFLRYQHSAAVQVLLQFTRILLAAAIKLNYHKYSTSVTTTTKQHNG